MDILNNYLVSARRTQIIGQEIRKSEILHKASVGAATLIIIQCIIKIMYGEIHEIFERIIETF